MRSVYHLRIFDSLPMPQCDCQGTKHGYYLNCLNCGRISCKYEKTDNCSFCSSTLKTLTVAEIPIHIERPLQEVIDEHESFADSKSWLNENELAQREQRRLESESSQQSYLNLEIENGKIKATISNKK